MRRNFRGGSLYRLPETTYQDFSKMCIRFWDFKLLIRFDVLFDNCIFTAQLNQAARHRNVYYETIGGDPYGEMKLFI